VLGLAAHAILPRTIERLVLDALRVWHLSEPSDEVSTGNLFEPGPQTPGTHGHRPPQVGTARFLAWITARLIQLEAEAASRLVGRARAWLRRVRGSAVSGELPERV